MHLMWNKKMVSLLYKFLLGCCKSVLHFIAVLKIVHTSRGSHDKVKHINYFVLPTSLTIATRNG